MSEENQGVQLKTTMWRHSITFKHLSDEEITVPAIQALCGSLREQLSRVMNFEEKQRDHADEREYYLRKLQDLIDQFESVAAPSEQPLEGWVEDFNTVLNELYDLGDSYIKLKGGLTQRFMCVG